MLDDVLPPPLGIVVTRRRRQLPDRIDRPPRRHGLHRLVRVLPGSPLVAAAFVRASFVRASFVRASFVRAAIAAWTLDTQAFTRRSLTHRAVAYRRLTRQAVTRRAFTRPAFIRGAIAGASFRLSLLAGPVGADHVFAGST